MDIIPSHLVERIFASLPPNYIAGTVRQISKDFRTAFTTKLIDVSQPVPPHALLWACSDDTLQRQLPLRHRLRLLALAVASCLDPEDLQLLGQTLSTLCGPVNGLDPKLYDPGIAAARAGNRAGAPCCFAPYRTHRLSLTTYAPLHLFTPSSPLFPLVLRLTHCPAPASCSSW